MAPEPSQAPVIGVAIIQDQRETREGLSLLINNAGRFECRHVYGSMEAALAGIGTNPPRVALVDIGLPGLSGIDGVRILRERYPSIAPVLLTVYKDDDRIFQAVCAGACGYLLKETPPARLLEAVREIAEGGAVMSPERSGHPGGGALSQNPDCGTVRHRPYTPGAAAPEAADGGPSKQNGGGGDGNQHSHRRLSSALDL